MIRSQFHTWLTSAAIVAMLATGCQMAGKKSIANKTPTPAGASAVPGTAEFTSSNKLQNPVKVHLAYAVWHEQEGNLIEARNAYDRVLKESPKNVDAMLGLARLDMALGRMDDAEGRLQKAQKLAPKNPQVAVSLGQYFLARGDFGLALEQMKLARSLSPYDPACAYHLGVVQAKSGDLESALSNFTEAVGSAEAEYNLAYILHQSGDFGAAEDHLKRAIALKPDLAQAQSLLISVRQRQSGKPQMAARNPAPAGSLSASQGVTPASYTEPDTRGR